jgi:hypothetical protein
MSTLQKILVLCGLLVSLLIYAGDPATMLEKLKGPTMPVGCPWERAISEMLSHSPKQPNFSPFSLTEFLIDTSRYYTSGGFHRYPGIAFDGTNFMAVWMESPCIVGRLIAPDGTLLAKFIIKSHAVSPDQPDIVFDGTNYFVVWMHDNIGADNGIYGARIKPDGTVLDPNGFLISSNMGYCPAVAYGAGVYLVVWQDTMVTGEWNALAALVDTNGSVLSEFPLRAQPQAYECWPNVAFNGTNFLTVWYVLDIIPPEEYGIMGSRITPDGTNLDPGGFHISNEANHMCPVVDFDGTNWFVVWDYGLGGGFWAAWVSPDGIPSAVFSLPGSSGLTFPELVLGDSLHWVEAIDIGDPNIYATRIDFNGNVLDVPWIAVDTSSGWQAYGGDAYGDSTFIAIWEDQVTYDIYARRYALDGSPKDSARFLVNLRINAQGYPGAAFDGSNYLVVYEDDRNGDVDIYGARVTQNGTIIDPEGFYIDTTGSQYWPRVAFGDSLYLCVYNAGAYIYGARVLPDGTILDPNGFQITFSGGDYCPSVSYYNGLFMVVYDHMTWNYGISGTRVTPGGQVLDPTGISIKPPAMNQNPWWPEIAPYENGFLVTWMLDGPDIIEGARIDFQGTVLDSPAIQISPPGVGEHWHGLASSGDTFLVVWDENLQDIYGARVDSSGAVLDPTGIPICVNQPNARTQPSVAFNGKDFLVVWQDSRLEPSQYDLFGARVSPAGIVLDTNGIEFVNSEYSRVNVELASATPEPDTGAQVLLVFDGFVGEPYNANRALGALYYPPTGIEEGYTQKISTGYRINISPNISCQKPYVLSYSLSKRTEISVNVYDITGRLVKNVYKGNIEGTGEIKFNLNGAAQGVYFVRIEADDKAEATKIVWLK